MKTTNTPRGQHELSSTRRFSARNLPASFALNVALIVVSIISLLPLNWVISTSLLAASEINAGQQTLLPTNPTIESYVELLTETGFAKSLMNSVIISVSVTVFGTLFCAGAGYAFGLLHFRGRKAIFLILLMTMMVPPLVTVPVNFVLMAKLGILNTLWAVVLPQLAPAFGVFWMRQFARASVPDAVLEAAELDGAGTLRTFWRVGMPMMRSGIAGLAIYMFLTSWNQFLLPLTYLQSNDKQTYTVFLSNLNSAYTTPQTHLALATAVLSVIPLLIIFIFGQRHFVAGVTSGAVKG